MKLRRNRRRKRSTAEELRRAEINIRRNVADIAGATYLSGAAAPHTNVSITQPHTWTARHAGHTLRNLFTTVSSALDERYGFSWQWRRFTARYLSGDLISEHRVERAHAKHVLERHARQKRIQDATRQLGPDSTL